MGLFGFVSKKEREREQRVLDAFSYRPQNVHGDSRSAGHQELHRGDCFNDRGIYFGDSRDGNHRLYFHGKIRPHVGLCGSSGLGKSILIQRMLLELKNHSVIVFDPTYEHTLVTHEWRAKRGPVYQWDPLRRFEKETRRIKKVRINPMSRLNPRRSDFEARCEEDAAGIIRQVEGHNSYFYDSPRELWAGCEIAQVLHGRPEDRNLPFIAREIFNGDLRDYCRRIVEGTNHPGLRARMQRFVPGEGNADANFLKSIGEFIQTGNTESHFLLNSAVAEGLSAQDFDLPSFGEREQTLYINAPLDLPKVFAPTNKLILNWILGEFFRDEAPRKIPKILVLDELFQYGRNLESLPAAYSAGRKYRTALYSCITSLGELKSMFPNDWESSVLNNMGLLQFLDAYSPQDSEYLSRLLGETEVYALHKSVSVPSHWNIPAFYGNREGASIRNIPSDKELAKLKVSDNYSAVKRPVMLPFEIRQSPLDEGWAFIREVPAPIHFKTVPFWKTNLKKRAGKNPFVEGTK